MAPLPITWVENVFDAGQAGIDGAAKWDHEHGDYAHLDYVCPCGCKEIRSLPVKVGIMEQTPERRPNRALDTVALPAQRQNDNRFAHAGKGRAPTVSILPGFAP